jgi:hypothetical protein
MQGIDETIRHHPTVSIVCFWGIGMLSYHQDAKHRLGGWAVISQILSSMSLIALVVFGFTHRDRWNFLIVPILIYLQFQFTRRWWARPGAWW